MSDIQEYYKSYYTRMGDTAYLGEAVANTSRMRQVREWLLRYAKPGARVLDIGCGDAIYAEQNPEFEWHGLDINCEKIKDRPIKAQNWDLEQAPYPVETGVFDVVITSEVLEHLFTPSTVHKEARRALKRDGVYIVTTPQHTWIVNLLRGFENLVYDEELSWRKEHIRTYTYEAHKKLLNRYGFVVDEFVGLDAHFCNVFGPTAEAIAKNLADHHKFFIDVNEIHRYMGQVNPNLHHTIGLVCKKV